MSSHFDKINELLQKTKQADNGGGANRIQSQHDKGKLTARERLDVLLDNDSFIELDNHPSLS